MTTQPGRTRRTPALTLWTALGTTLCMALCTSCTTTGTAIARVADRQGEVVPARMAWRTPSAYGAFGELAVELPDGTVFRGPYRLVGEPDDLTRAVWQPWRPGWPDWPLPWEGAALPVGVALDERSLSDRYRGLAIASLASDDGERLRCRFGLLQPTVGLAGGVDGDCQVLPSPRGRALDIALLDVRDMTRE